MSFILDALKKSENDRQRQSGPALFEVRVAPPRQKFPLLAVVIVALLVVNIGVVGWLLLRDSGSGKSAAAAPANAANAQNPGGQAQAAGGASAQQNAGAIPQGVPPAGSPAGQQAYAYAPPQGSAAYGNPAGGYAAPPAGGYPAPPPGYAPPPGAQYAAPGAQYGAPAGQYGMAAQPGGYAPPAQGMYPQQNAFQGGGNFPSGDASAYGARRDPMLADQDIGSAPFNPDDYLPAQPSASTPTGPGRVTRGTESGLPTYEEVASRTSLPPLRLDMHSYAAEPSRRFVLINMKRLYEGEALPDGTKVESITSDAAVLSYKGTRFVLHSN